MSETNKIQRLAKVTRDLAEASSIEDITRLVRSASREIADSQGATFVLRENGHCHYVDEEAISPLWKGQRFPLQSCISGWCMLSKKSLVVPDIYKDARIPHDAYRPTFVRSLAMHPIGGENPVGAIGTYWNHQHIPPNETMELLQALADATSVALRNVELREQNRRMSRELRTAQEARDQFLMNMSHELRTPLHAIQGWAALLLSQDDMTPDERRGALEIIGRSVKMQTQIIDDLFDVDRIIRGGLTIEPEAISIVDLAQQAIDSVLPEAARRGITIRFDSEIRQGEVWGDPRRLRQIYGNLLSNALKFSERGSEIEVSLKRVGPGAEFVVRDYGSGISASALPNVFDRFLQGDSSTTRKHGGLGLGLAIVKNLVEAHNGRVVAKSDGPKKGATFTVTIPMLDRRNMSWSEPASSLVQ